MIDGKKAIAIMQPYFFPYIGYWQLLAAVDTFVIYDDGKYIKDGWIHRNRVLGADGNPMLLKIDIDHPTVNNAINQTLRINNPIRSSKLIKTLVNSYSKAPYFHQVIDLVTPLIMSEELDLVKYLSHQIKEVSRYLGLDTEFRYSSEVSKEGLAGVEDKVFRICHQMGCVDYYNPIGGTEFYDKQDWLSRGGVNLHFLKRNNDISYTQKTASFVPDLSIIDIMMYNSVEEIRQLLQRYTIC